MGTQWVIRGRDFDREYLGGRPPYRPRHAKSGRRGQQGGGRAGERVAAWPSAGGAAEPFIVTGCETYGYAPVSIRQVLLDRAAIFVRGHSRHYGDRRWSHESTG